MDWSGLYIVRDNTRGGQAIYRTTVTADGDACLVLVLHQSNVIHLHRRRMGCYTHIILHPTYPCILQVHYYSSHQPLDQDKTILRSPRQFIRLGTNLLCCLQHYQDVTMNFSLMALTYCTQSDISPMNPVARQRTRNPKTNQKMLSLACKTLKSHYGHSFLILRQEMQMVGMIYLTWLRLRAAVDVTMDQRRINHRHWQRCCPSSSPRQSRYWLHLEHWQYQQRQRCNSLML